MKPQWPIVLFSILSLLATAARAAPLPTGFVYLSQVDPSIVQELRYTGFHNFIGRPIKGYAAGAGCIVTRAAAQALKAVQDELRPLALSLKVYDCYRPQQAVNDFVAWSKQPDDQKMKTEFYPRVNKAEVFQRGYIAEKSGHSRGSTLDLTLVPLPVPPQELYHPGQKLVACYKPYYLRFPDNSINMGSGYDCLDEVAHVDYQGLTPQARNNRALLSQHMMKHGFKSYSKEWWHFTLAKEPYPQTYFNFPVTPDLQPSHPPEHH